MALATRARDQMAIVIESRIEDFDAADGVWIGGAGPVRRVCIEESDLVGVGDRHIVEHDLATVHADYIRR